MSSPGHVLPVVRGRGAEHVLCRCCLVPPQKVVHSDHDDQSLHPPSTVYQTHKYKHDIESSTFWARSSCTHSSILITMINHSSILITMSNHSSILITMGNHSSILITMINHSSILITMINHSNNHYMWEHVFLWYKHWLQWVVIYRRFKWHISVSQSIDNIASRISRLKVNTNQSRNISA